MFLNPDNICQLHFGYGGWDQKNKWAYAIQQTTASHQVTKQSMEKTSMTTGKYQLTTATMHIVRKSTT